MLRGWPLCVATVAEGVPPQTVVGASYRDLSPAPTCDAKTFDQS